MENFYNSYICKRLLECWHIYAEHCRFEKIVHGRINCWGAAYFVSYSPRFLCAIWQTFRLKPTCTLTLRFLGFFKTRTRILSP